MKSNKPKATHHYERAPSERAMKAVKSNGQAARLSRRVPKYVTTPSPGPTQAPTDTQAERSDDPSAT